MGIQKKNVSFRADSLKGLCQISHLWEAQPTPLSFEIQLRCYILCAVFLTSLDEVRCFLPQLL